MIATKIMGWKRHQYSNSPDQMQPPGEPTNSFGIQEVRLIPKWYLDIQKAWEVYEAVLAKAGSGCDRWHLTQKRDDLPTASFLFNELNMESISVIAEDMPLAICICALLVSGVDVDISIYIGTEEKEIL